MSTAVLEREEVNTITIDLNSIVQVNPALRIKADAVLVQFDMSVSRAVDLLLNYIVKLKRVPDVLTMPPIPCIDDLTEEEFDAMIQEAVDDVEAGRTYTIDEVRQMLEAEDAKI